MKNYATTPLNFFELIKQSFGSYNTVFKHTWPLVVLTAILSLLNSMFWHVNPYVATAILVLMALLIIFIYAMVLFSAHHALKGQPITMAAAFDLAKKRYLPLLGGYVILAAIVILLFLITFGFFSLTDLPRIGGLFNILAVLAVVFTVFVIYLLFFVFPLIALDNKPVWKSFDTSVRLVWGSWWRVFGVLLIVHLLIVIVSLLGTMLIPSRAIWILAIWNAIVSFIFYPLVIGTLLTLFHDLKLRHPNVR
jgi:hypothetical protein